MCEEKSKVYDEREKVGGEQDSTVLKAQVNGCDRKQNEENIGSLERQEHNKRDLKQ